mmetsp:Transcript_99102/g.308854  ORF Transcript_99102/g.308854 Transcript_99102/m.308854 type:complete len:301 (+) Transcript_99102:562-1464(+)
MTASTRSRRRRRCQPAPGPGWRTSRPTPESTASGCPPLRTTRSTSPAPSPGGRPWRRCTGWRTVGRTPSPSRWARHAWSSFTSRPTRASIWPSSRRPRWQTPRPSSWPWQSSTRPRLGHRRPKRREARRHGVHGLLRLRPRVQEEASMVGGHGGRGRAGAGRGRLLPPQLLAGRNVDRLEAREDGAGGQGERAGRLQGRHQDRHPPQGGVPDPQGRGPQPGDLPGGGRWRRGRSVAGAGPGPPARRQEVADLGQDGRGGASPVPCLGRRPLALHCQLQRSYHLEQRHGPGHGLLRHVHLE